MKIISQVVFKFDEFYRNKKQLGMSDKDIAELLDMKKQNFAMMKDSISHYIVVEFTEGFVLFREAGYKKKVKKENEDA